MWRSRRGREPKPQLDALFDELMHECKHNALSARFSSKLRAKIERLRPGERRGLCARKRLGAGPLLVAARRGAVEAVEYLVHVCNADLEQRGRYDAAEDGTPHRVTALWAAAVAGQLGAVRALADAGADVDAASDSGSTPARSACFMTHLEVVRFLADRGADLSRPNHNGGTCLINAVQSAPLCSFLLARGADVDACDVQLKTALHYAVQEQRADTARALLAAGADPRRVSRAGDCCVRAAALRGAGGLLPALAAAAGLAPAALADAHELLGATQLDEYNDAAAALESWRRATALRAAAGAAKPPGPPAAALGGAVEWTRAEQLDEMDADALRTQALLVAVRVLGAGHRDATFRLMYRGAAYADAGRYARCVRLWQWALQLRAERDGLLCADACHAACALARLLVEGRRGRLERNADAVPEHQQVVDVFDVVAGQLPECRRLLQARPVYKKQAETFDRLLRCVTHLVWLLQETAGSEAQARGVRARVRALVAADVRSASGDTLLHLVASRLNVLRSTYFTDDINMPGVFPSASVAALLAACGADGAAVNAARSSALHVGALPHNASRALLAALLAAGGHMDAPNRYGASPAALLALAGAAPALPLRCLAARALAAAPPAARAGPLPATLRDFLQLHMP